MAHIFRISEDVWSFFLDDVIAIFRLYDPFYANAKYANPALDLDFEYLM